MKTWTLLVVGVLAGASSASAGTCEELRSSERAAEERAMACRRDMCGEDEHGKRPGIYDERRCREDCPRLDAAARDAREARERGCKEKR
jgi:hypothetical protein